MKAHRSHRVNAKISENDYRVLRTVADTYGFRSIYQLVQTLILCFLRHVDSVRDAQEETSMGAEISEMFDDLMDERPRTSSFTTYTKAMRKSDFDK